MADNYHPGIYCKSRSTKRTASIILSSKEVSLPYGKLKKTKTNTNETELEEDEKGDATNEASEEYDQYVDNEDDDNFSISSQQSYFFHPRNYFNGHFNQQHVNKSMATMSVKSFGSVIAAQDEMETLANMDELHNFEKHKQLGTGTDAFVYEVIDRRDKSHVAMKLTKRKSGRYRTEIHLLHQLRTCKYVVRLIKVLEDDSVYILLLEQAPMTLEMLLHERCTVTPMQEGVGREIVSDLLRGIKAIHNLGFVHKDIKPENVLIFADRVRRKLMAKIADFGFATRAQPPNDIINNNNNNKFIPKQTLSEFVERVGDKCGTPGFWAPELVAGVVELNEAFKMDVFSCGVTLYRMLCNEMPFGLFETWDLKQEGKLAKMKPNFQVVSWIQTRNKLSGQENEQSKIDYIRKLAAFNISNNAVSLLRGMLRIRPNKRFDVIACLNHAFFNNLPSK